LISAPAIQGLLGGNAGTFTIRRIFFNEEWQMRTTHGTGYCGDVRKGLLLQACLMLFVGSCRDGGDLQNQDQIEDIATVKQALSGTYYVALTGSDSTGNGSSATPWRTIRWAWDHVLDDSLILVRPGAYVGLTRLGDHSFTQGVTVRSEVPYKAQLVGTTEHALKVLSASGLVVEGFDISHDAAASQVSPVAQADCFGGNGRITFKNNIFHDSRRNDLLKINNGCTQLTVQGNIFYNQSGRDEHIDVNGVNGVVVEDNVFFNDFARDDTSAFIVIKDSSDVFHGARNVTVRRNVLLNWVGRSSFSDPSGFIRIGEDGHPYFEADGVTLENNLILGNSADVFRSPLIIEGSQNITFRNNTISGVFPPSGANPAGFAMYFQTIGLNVPSQNVNFFNNVYVNQSGSMGRFSDSRSDKVTAAFAISDNLYWNGGGAIPSDPVNDRINYTNDPAPVFGNPVLALPSGIALPRWNPGNSSFNDGSTTIEQTRQRLIDAYARPGAGSAVVDQADPNPARAAADDIRGVARGPAPDIGAYEVAAGGTGGTGGTSGTGGTGGTSGTGGTGGTSGTGGTGGSGGDTTPPTVGITAPSGGTTVSDFVTLAASASDTQTGVAGVQFKVDGANYGVEDTTAPYSIEVDTTKLTNASHTFAAVARDGASNTATASVTVTVQNQCHYVGQPSTGSPANVFQPITPAQTGTFTVKATVIPTWDNHSDGGIGLAQGQPATWSAGVSNIVLFGPGGTIQVFNGATGTYGADAVVNYQLLKRYRIRLVSNVAASPQTYSVWVTLEDGSEIQLASNYQWRFARTSLDNRVSRAEIGQFKICNFRLVP
jgi:hypothetical protein